MNLIIKAEQLSALHLSRLMWVADKDILEWFKMESEDWNASIQTALRLYVEANKEYRRDQSG